MENKYHVNPSTPEQYKSLPPVYPKRNLPNNMTPIKTPLELFNLKKAYSFN